MNPPQASFYIGVPVYNEERNVPGLVNALAVLVEALSGRFRVSVVVVDDGSTDATVQRVRELGGTLPLVILRHERNRGPGAAFATLFDHVAPTLSDSDWLLTLEGDNTSRHELVDQLLGRAREGWDAVLASPHLRGGGIRNTSAVRVVLSAGASVFARRALGLGAIATVSSFFRLYRGRLIRELQRTFGAPILETCGFECMLEMTVKMILVGASISEVPMVLDGSARIGASKMRVAPTIRGYLTVWRSKNRWARHRARSISIRATF